MYSKAKGITEQSMPLPPGYRGNRFSAEKQTKIPDSPLPSKSRTAAEFPEKTSGPLDFIRSMGREELLIISLIIVLAGEQKRAENDTLFMLILLLLVR